MVLLVPFSDCKSLAIVVILGYIHLKSVSMQQSKYPFSTLFFSLLILICFLLFFAIPKTVVNISYKYKYCVLLFSNTPEKTKAL